jgi:hypothetical protein
MARPFLTEVVFYVLQFVKSFTIYYIKILCPRIWISEVYVQELR